MNPHPDSHQAVLSDRALHAFGLHSQPFSERPAGNDYFSDPVMQMQLNMLQHNIKFSDMLQVLKGDAGCGKTALVIQMLASANDEFQIFVARGTPSLSALQIISGMLKIFQQPVPDETDRCVGLLIEHLRMRLDKSLSSVLIIENAHLIPATALNQLFESTDRINEVLDGELRILLVAEPEIESILPDLTSKQLRDGKIFISNVRTLDRKRTADYLSHRLQIAGLKGDLPFSGRQLTDLYTNTDGIPQRIDVVAAQMLNQQAGQQPVTNHLDNLPLRPITAGAVGAIAVSLLMFMFAGGDNNPDRIDADPTTDNEPQKVVELTPKVIPSGDQPVVVEHLDEAPPTPTDAASEQPKTGEPVDAEIKAPVNEPKEPAQPAAATITLLSEASQNTNFVESHGVDKPTPAKVEPPDAPAPKVKPVTAKPEIAKPEPRKLSDAENWLLTQQPDRYVIQLIASYDRSVLQRYVNTHRIESKTALFETSRQSRSWHVLTYRLYATAEAARAAITKLPAELKRNTPWIRSIKSIQQAIKQRG